MRVGFVINPIAGMGGKVGLKGTDGVYEKAVELGAEPVATKRAEESLQNMKGEHTWFTAGGVMGESSLKQYFEGQKINVVYEPKKDSIGRTKAEETHEVVRRFIDKHVDLIVFCGGDGTARDIYEEVDKEKPILGIPAGVKMHSGCFGINPEGSAQLFNDFVDGKADTGEVEIMDLDEEKYREGDWEIKMHGQALSIYEPHYIQLGKQSFRSVDQEDQKRDIAHFLIDEMEENPGHLFVLGPGSTTAEIQKVLGLDYTILGVDLIKNKEIVELDVAEKEILEQSEEASGLKIIVSMIGNQGFFLGRGNQQISPKVVKKAGLDNIYILSTPTKLKKTANLRADTGDEELDKKISEKGYMKVVQGYREYRLVEVQAGVHLE
ncbi:MAG: ATP-NAD kinase family protein [Candidatus Thermoplasmatota archaeon]|nr:ATP-NAD kinase family protein [Candidatus Thermoplasmatota archaeon]MBS3789486.1 ATP-NAD kinase family protein [Candidatus Thermoplasmatota archaeon]